MAQRASCPAPGASGAVPAALVPLQSSGQHQSRGDLLTSGRMRPGILTHRGVGARARCHQPGARSGGIGQRTGTGDHTVLCRCHLTWCHQQRTHLGRAAGARAGMEEDEEQQDPSCQAQRAPANPVRDLRAAGGGTDHVPAPVPPRSQSQRVPDLHHEAPVAPPCPPNGVGG